MYFLIMRDDGKRFLYPVGHMVADPPLLLIGPRPSNVHVESEKVVQSAYVPVSQGVAAER